LSRRIKIRYPGGESESLRDYLKRLSIDDIRSEIRSLLETMQSRTDITDDRSTLSNILTVLVWFNAGEELFLDNNVDNGRT